MFGSTHDSPLSLGSLQDEMGRLLERFWHAGVSTPPFDGQKWAPLIDVYEFGDHYLLHAELPGVERGGIELSCVNNVLTIRGEKTAPAEARDASRSVRNERRFGTFCRSLDLPGDVDADKFSATCQNGILTVTMPKPESARAREIKVQVSS